MRLSLGKDQARRLEALAAVQARSVRPVLAAAPASVDSLLRHPHAVIFLWTAIGVIGVMVQVWPSIETKVRKQPSR